MRVGDHQVPRSGFIPLFQVSLGFEDQAYSKNQENR
jgi:hypothetical protein